MEFAENIALALKVCELHGIGREVALEGMRNAAPDPGVMQTTHMEVEGTKLCFVNAFAANDYDSTEKIINDVREQVNGCGDSSGRRAGDCGGRPGPRGHA